MEQSSTDRRVRKTKKQLRLALMELLAEKSAKSISVRELAERRISTAAPSISTIGT